jgi:hypothetical protein
MNRVITVVEFRFPIKKSLVLVTGFILIRLTNVFSVFATKVGGKG